MRWPRPPLPEPARRPLDRDCRSRFRMGVGEPERPRRVPASFLRPRPAPTLYVVGAFRVEINLPSSAREGLGGRISLPYELQALKREPVVDLVDLFAEGHDGRREAARGDGRGLLVELLPDAAEDRVDLPGEAVYDARLDGLLGALSDRVAGLLDLHARKAGGSRREGLERDLDAGRYDPAEVLPRRRDHVVVDRGAEVDRDAGPAHAVVGRDGVDEPVRAELLGPVDPDRHSALDVRAHEQAAAV